MALASTFVEGTKLEIRPLFFFIYFRGYAAISNETNNLEIFDPLGFRSYLEHFAKKILSLKNQGIFLYLDCPREYRDLK